MRHKSLWLFRRAIVCRAYLKRGWLATTKIKQNILKIKCKKAKIFMRCVVFLLNQCSVKGYYELGKNKNCLFKNYVLVLN